MTKKENVIVFSTDDNYALATYIAMYSILLHSNCEMIYRFYILVPDDLRENYREILLEIKDEFTNAEICVISIVDIFQNNRTLRHVTSATYYRLMLPEVLKEERCLYLDQDIVVQRDINEIFQIDIGDNLIAGVKEQIAENIWQKNKDVYMDVGLESFQNYINAGVILFNLKEIRKTDWYQKAKLLAKKDLPYGDQDIVNILCRNRIHFLPEECNHIVRNRERQVTERTIVLHYAGYQKPWEDLDTICGEKWWQVCWKTKLRDEFIAKASCQFFYVYQNRNQELSSKIELLELCKRHHTIAIYGGGNVGRLVIDYLKRNGVNINSIVVKSLEGNSQDVSGIPVRTLDYYKDEKDEILILLAVLFDNPTIIKELYEQGYQKVLRVSELFWER